MAPTGSQNWCPWYFVLDLCGNHRQILLYSAGRGGPRLNSLRQLPFTGLAPAVLFIRTSAASMPAFWIPDASLSQSLGYPSVAVGHQSVTVIGQYLASCRFGTPPRLLMARLHRRQSGWLDAVAAARAQAGHCDKGMLGPSRALVPCPRVSSKLRAKKVKTMFSKFGGVSDMSLSLNGSYCLLAPDYRSVEAIHDSETRHSRFVLDHLDTLQHLQSKVPVRPWCAPVERTRTSEH